LADGFQCLLIRSENPGQHDGKEEEEDSQRYEAKYFHSAYFFEIVNEFHVSFIYW